MEPIVELKIMRGDALSRLHFNADYRLLVSLDAAIDDLERLGTEKVTPLRIVGNEAEILDFSPSHELEHAEIAIERFRGLKQKLSDESPPTLLDFAAARLSDG